MNIHGVTDFREEKHFVMLRQFTLIEALIVSEVKHVNKCF